MQHLSTSPSPQIPATPRRVAVVGSIRHTAAGRTVTTTVTEAGVSGRITPAGGVR